MEFHHCHISEAGKRYVNEALDSGYVNEGPFVKWFEKALEDKFGYRNVVAVNSGTSALHLALILAGAEKLDVILPAQTFVATGMAVLMAGAKPVFADVGKRTGLLDMVDAERRMTDFTAAVIGVHWTGMPTRVPSGLWDRVPFVGDAAHALGALRTPSVNVTEAEDYTCFSFQSIKHVTGANAGALTCPDEETRDRARRLRWFGLDRETAKPGILGEREGDITELSYKYHLVDLNAALALGNLEDFDERLEKRREIAKHYFDYIDADLLPNRRRSDLATSSCWLFPLLVDRREDFIRAMADCGVPTNVCHQRIDRYSVFGGLRGDLPGTDYWDSHQVNIPCHEGLTDEDVEQVVDAVQEGW